MKHFKVIGPETTREFDILDDEMIHWDILKIKDYKPVEDPPLKNEKIYPTEQV